MVDTSCRAGRLALLCCLAWAGVLAAEAQASTAAPATRHLTAEVAAHNGQQAPFPGTPQQNAQKHVQLALAACSMIYVDAFLTHNTLPSLEEVVAKAQKKTIGDGAFDIRYHVDHEAGVIKATAKKGQVTASGSVQLRQPGAQSWDNAAENP